MNEVNMTLRDQLNESLKIAMKEKNDLKKSTIRGILSNIKNQEIDKQITLSDEEIIAVLYKELKIRDEAIDGARKSQRTDLIEEGEKESEIIKSFLPKGLDEEEIKKFVVESVNEVNATSMADMGKVMKVVLPKVAGKAPNNLVSKIVKDVLSS